MDKADNVITRDSDIIRELISGIRTMEAEIDAMKAKNLTCGSEWMNGEEVMKKLGISKRTLQNYRDGGILPYSVVGGKFYYCCRDIETMMAENYVSGRRK